MKKSTLTILCFLLLFGFMVSPIKADTSIITNYEQYLEDVERSTTTSFLEYKEIAFMGQFIGYAHLPLSDGGGVYTYFILDDAGFTVELSVSCTCDDCRAGEAESYNKHNYFSTEYPYLLDYEKKDLTEVADPKDMRNLKSTAPNGRICVDTGTIKL